MKLCPQGHAVLDDHRFCTICGAAPVEAPAPPPVPPAPVVPPAAPPTAKVPVSAAQPTAGPAGPPPPAGFDHTTAFPAVPGPTSSPPRRSRTVWVVAAAAVAVACVVGIVVGLSVGQHGRSSNAAATSATTTAAAPDTAAPDTAAPQAPETTTTDTTVSPVTPDPQSAAEAQLASLAAVDQGQVDSVLDQWVPQISSKRVGLSDPRDSWFPNQVYTSQMILQSLTDWQNQLGNHILVLNSSNYISHTPGYWVFVYDETFPDADSVISWCQQENLNDDNCGASRISHTIPYGAGTYKGW